MERPAGMGARSPLLLHAQLAMLCWVLLNCCHALVAGRCRPQVDHNVERELLNHRKLSGHLNIVQFKEVSPAGWGQPELRACRPGAAAPAMPARAAASLSWVAPCLRTGCGFTPTPGAGVCHLHAPGHCDGVREVGARAGVLAVLLSSHVCTRRGRSRARPAAAVAASPPSPGQAQLEPTQALLPPLPPVACLRQRRRPV